MILLTICYVIFQLKFYHAISFFFLMELQSEHTLNTLKKKHIDSFLNNTLSSSPIEWIQQMVDFMFARENHLNILIIYDDQ